MDVLAWYPNAWSRGPFPSKAFEAHRDGVMRSGVHLVKSRGGGLLRTPGFLEPSPYSCALLPTPSLWPGHFWF